MNPALAGNTLPEGPGRSVVYDNCQACHSLGFIVKRKRSQDERGKIVDKMVIHGLEIGEKNHKMILDYLATYLGSSP